MITNRGFVLYWLVSRRLSSFISRDLQVDFSANTKEEKNVYDTRLEDRTNPISDVNIPGSDADVLSPL